MRNPILRRAAARTAFLLLFAAGVGGLGAQPVLDIEEELDFDHPEAWAMKFFTSASLLTSLGPVERREAGAVDLGLELITIPHLDREQRTVGFGGFKEEELNRLPVWARLRVAFGLPRGFTAVVGWVPPAELDGVKANLFSAAIEKAILQGDRWGLGVRLYAQVGDAEADFTCAAGEERSPPGSPENPFGCEAPSDDEVTLEYVGLEWTGSYRFRRPRAPVLHLGVAVNHLDMEFQVNARTFGFLDRTRLLADGETVSATAGATWSLGQKTKAGVEVFYSPLSVERPGAESSDNDPLLHLRALLRYRLR